MRKKNLILLFCIFFFKTYSQNSYEFIGIIMINHEKDKMIPYRLVFEEENGEINGYSVTDFDGDHETKSSITGKYNQKSNIFSFKETDILYTKSNYSPDIFCFVHFEGNLELHSDVNKSKLRGNFKGFFPSDEPCLNGYLTLLGSDAIYKKMAKIDKKIQKLKNITEEEKNKISTVKLMDSLKVNRLSNNEKLNVFIKNDTFKIEIFDAGIEDNDIVDFYINDRKVLSDFKVTKNVKMLSYSFNNEPNLEFKLIAKNTGEEGLNTPKIIINDGNRKFELFANLNANESGFITVYKK
ncbi:hypothetical protein [Flavobacterium sp.]|uniref:hypothetical protein n=1 Tax=Flavobacterium sp. TaxID=239 RepID=UPI003528885C